MSQDFNILSTSNVIREDVARHNTNYATLRSQFSGTTFPSNPTVGQACFRTDLGQVVTGGGVTGRWYVYSGNTSAGLSGWVNSQNMGEIESEIVNARGSKLTLDQRLDIALNEDGTLKQNAVATISEWQSLGATFTYVDTTTFTTDGNTTDIYLSGRKIKVNLNSSVFYARVVSSTYTTVTTVVIDTASLDATLLDVDYHIVSPQNDDDIQNASEVSYDNTTSGLIATDVKSAIDETVTLSRGFKNYIINGGFDIWQRGTSFTNPSTTSSTYYADRWVGRRGGSVDGLRLFLSAVYPIGASQSLAFGVIDTDTQTNEVALATALETNISKKLAGKTVTISADVSILSSCTSSGVSIILRGGTGTDEGGSPYGFTTGNVTLGLVTHTIKDDSFHKVSKTISIPDSITQLMISVVTNSFSGVASTNNMMRIANVQLEEGSVATPFEQRPYGLELSLCRRYYQILEISDSFIATASQISYKRHQFYEEMRATPTITYSGTVGLQTNVSSIAVSGISKYGFRTNMTSTTSGQTYFLERVYYANSEL